MTRADRLTLQTWPKIFLKNKKGQISKKKILNSGKKSEFEKKKN